MSEAHCGRDTRCVERGSSKQTAKPLENGAPGNLFGGIGSGLGFAGGDRFIAVPDRGPNAQPYNDCIDDTTSYVNRFHTLRLRLLPSSGPGLPFVLKPSLEQTTLMASSTPLTYGDGLAGCPTVPAGAPKLNKRDTFYFTGPGWRAYSIGLVQLFFNWDRVAAEASMRRALQSDPTDVLTHRSMAALLLTGRQPQAAIEQSRRRCGSIRSRWRRTTSCALLHGSRKSGCR